MKYSDEQRLHKIYEKGNMLLEYIRDHDVKKSDLMNDTALQWLVTTPLSNIGDHAYYISDEYKVKHPEIQWNMIAGLRHRLMTMTAQTGLLLLMLCLMNYQSL